MLEDALRLRPSLPSPVNCRVCFWCHCGALHRAVWRLAHCGHDAARSLPVAAGLPSSWMRDRDDSPWYPTARLFRQPAISDWDAVVARVRDELARFVGSRT
jgi:hypothetical protein